MDLLNIKTDAFYTQATEKRLKSKIKLLEQQGQQNQQDDKLLKVCQEFESILIKQMLNVMRKTVQKSGMMDGGFAEEIFEDMLYDEYAASMSKHGNFGLAKTVYNQLSSYVEK